MAVNTTQGVTLAIFGANAGGHLTALDAIATSNGLAALAGDLSATAGLILGVDLSTDAAYTSTVLGNLGIEAGTDGYTLADAYFTSQLAAGASRGSVTATAVEYLLGDNVDASLSTVATSFTASVEAGVEYSQGEGASVFGVAQLQTAAGSAATAGEGSSFALTSEEDTLQGTSGNDTFTGTTANLSLDDRILDSSTGDSDTFNLTATGDPGAMDVTNVENINIDWDAYGTADVDLDNVTGSTVTLTSDKTGYLGNANFDNVEGNAVATGAGVTGVVTVDGIEDSTVTSSVASELDIGTGTAADGTITVNAGAAETVTLVGADDAVIVANSAETITVNTAFDTADITVGVDVDLEADGASDSTITLRSSATEEVQVVVGTTFEAETLVVADGSNIELDFTDSADINGLTVTNGGNIILASDMGTASTISDVEHILITAEDTFAAASTITAADDLNILFEEDITNAVDVVLKSTADSGNDSATVTFEKTTTAAIDFAVATNTDFENVTIVADGSADITLNSVVATGNTVTLQSPTNDLTVSAIVAETVDAASMTTDLTLTQVTAGDMTVALGSGDNSVTLAGTTHENTVVGADGDDTITLVTSEGNASILAAGGDNTLSVASITSGDAFVSAGAGDDTLTLGKMTSAEAAVQMGDGDNEVTLLPGTLAGAEITITTGTGDDTINFDDANNANIVMTASDEIVLTLGTGTDVLDFSAVTTADMTAGTFTASGLETIEFGSVATNVTLDGAFLNGESYLLRGDGTVADLAVVHLDVAGSYDFSDLQIDGTIAKAMGGLNITGNASADTIIGTDGGDTIDTAEGDNVVDGGLGADIITLGDNDDTIVIGKKAATQNASFAGANTTADNIDEYSGLDFGSEDTIQLSSAPNAYGAGITLDSDTIINVISIASATETDTMTEFFSTRETSTNGTASTSDVLYIYYSVETGGVAGTLEDGTYLVINDGTSTLTADDTIIKIGGAGGVSK